MMTYADFEMFLSQLSEEDKNQEVVFFDPDFDVYQGIDPIPLLAGEDHAVLDRGQIYFKLSDAAKYDDTEEDHSSLIGLEPESSFL